MLSNCWYEDIGYVKNVPKNYLSKSIIKILYINESFDHPYVVLNQFVQFINVERN